MGEVVDTQEGEHQAPTPAHMLQTALERGLNPDQLGQFMDLYERWESEQSRKAYSAALVAAQGEMPAIAAKAWNDQTKSSYAKLDAIVKAITPVFTRHGLSLTFSEGESPKEGHVRVLCDVTHESGHTVRYHIDMPIVTTGIKGNQMMTPTHATGSAFSYGRRYLTCMIGNLSVGDDDDGNSAGEAPEVDIEPSLMERMMTAASNGMEAYKAEWEQLDKAERTALKPIHNTMKERARQADEGSTDAGE